MPHNLFFPEIEKIVIIQIVTFRFSKHWNE